MCTHAYRKTVVFSMLGNWIKENWIKEETASNKLYNYLKIPPVFEGCSFPLKSWCIWKVKSLRVKITVNHMLDLGENSACGNT